MPAFKDHFSKQSKAYGEFRPQYPQALYEYLSGICSSGHELVWDCATGTGQAARGLSGYFDNIIATDASAQQIASAAGPENVTFRVALAEGSGLDSASVDLVTVAQALHWFDLSVFYDEVKRVLKPKGILAVWTYDLLKIEDKIDGIIEKFNDDIIGEYWPAERQLVRDRYRKLSFPFNERGLTASSPEFNMTAQWSLDDLMGYLATWSSVAAYKDVRNKDPLREIYADLCAAWGVSSDKKDVKWPLSLRIGRI